MCRNCRCCDCYIVLSLEICTVSACRLRHGEPSGEDPSLCAECMKIRQRVALLDIESLELRRSEAVLEQP